MQAKDISRFTDEREDKLMQRAVLGLALHEFPAQMTMADLSYRGLGKGERLEIAVQSLATVGLLWRQGEVVLPSLPARHFHWLEWS